MKMKKTTPSLTNRENKPSSARCRFLKLVAIGLSLPFAVAAPAQQSPPTAVTGAKPTFVTFDVPGADATAASGIDAAGTIAGTTSIRPAATALCAPPAAP
jgi:hypothetical protein